jgi:hydroxyacylglutathione hydrolase
MRVTPILLFEDNFSYLIQGSKAENCILVDPAESKKIIDHLENFPDLRISHIFLTHKHWDHVGDLPVLLKELEAREHKNIEVVSGEVDKIKGTTLNITDRQTFEINEIQITGIPTPCHTLGAVCFYLEDKNHLTHQNSLETIKKDGTECYRCVFTGDTHFVGGCGRFFEGNAEMMLKNMDTLAELPKDTFVFPGHEYTLANLNWSMGIEWENEAYAKKAEWVKQRAENGEFSIPSQISEEFDINIFWRTRVPLIQEKTGSTNPVDVMAALRSLKDKKASLKPTI